MVGSIEMAYLIYITTQHLMTCHWKKKSWDWTVI